MSAIQQRYTRTWELLLSKKTELQRHVQKNASLSAVIQQYDEYYRRVRSEKQDEYDALYALGAHIHSMSDSSEDIMRELNQLQMEIDALDNVISPATGNKMK